MFYLYCEPLIYFIQRTLVFTFTENPSEVPKVKQLLVQDSVTDVNI